MIYMNYSRVLEQQAGRQVLNIMMEFSGENFIIIDALDECSLQDNERDELCERLKDLASSKRLHLVATGR